MFLDIPRVFQGDVSLSGVLLLITIGFLEVIGDIQPLALVNFRIPLGSLRSFSSGNIVYTITNLPTSPIVGARSNSFIFWIKVSINITTPHSDIFGGSLYTRVIKSSLIISVIPPERYPSSFRFAITYLNNATVLAV